MACLFNPIASPISLRKFHEFKEARMLFSLLKGTSVANEFKFKKKKSKSLQNPNPHPFTFN